VESSDLARVVIEDFLTGPVVYDPDALARDIARHQAGKARGEAGLAADAARHWLRDAAGG
jgi:hypothetical protein